MANAHDTEANWRLIGQQDPFWGVLSHDRFRRANLDDASLAEFYDSGERDIALICNRVVQSLGVFPSVGDALDFGCGVGRLTFAMAKRAERVVGYDVSPGMLEVARRSPVQNVCFEPILPAGSFDWINSQIVFQHIPPVRGLELLDEILTRLRPGGFITLHFTLFRDEGVATRRLVRFLRFLHFIRRSLRIRRSRELIAMFDYDLGDIFVRCHKHNLGDISLFHTKHGIHHGVLVVGKRSEASVID